MKPVSVKSTFPFLPFVFLLLALLIFPRTCSAYAKTGLMLWFYTLFPSLLPFLILSGLFLRCGLFDRIFQGKGGLWTTCFGLSPKGGCCLLLGLFCGYPMGAKITGDLFREKKLSYEEACYLLTFACFPGPSYLSAYLCVGLLQNSALIWPTYGIIYFSSFLCSLFFRRIYRKRTVSSPSRPPQKQKKTAKVSLMETLDVSILDSFETMTKLGGYIILFSVLQGILLRLLSGLPALQYFLCGLGEISTGASLLTESSLPLSLSYPLILAFTACGGLCVAAQTKSVLAKTGLPLRPYLYGKLFCFFSALALGSLFVKIVEIVV